MKKQAPPVDTPKRPRPGDAPSERSPGETLPPGERASEEAEAQVPDRGLPSLGVWIAGLVIVGLVAIVALPSLFHCVVEGTPIATPGGERPVEQLREGDIVWTQGPTQLEPGRVTRVSRHVVWGYRALRLDDGRVLGVTAAHPVRTGSGWHAAGMLRPDEYLQLEGEQVRLLANVHTGGPTVVYDLTVEPNPNFFAAGILVHNKRTSANESEAVGDVRSVISAQVAYQSIAGAYGPLNCLRAPSSDGCISGYPPTAPTFLDEPLTSLRDRSGYRRRFVPGPPQPTQTSPSGIASFCYSAVPTTPGRTGIRGFAGDQTGRICVDAESADLCIDGSLPADCRTLD